MVEKTKLIYLIRNKKEQSQGEITINNTIIKSTIIVKNPGRYL
jgi:hypothetical protein